MNIKICLAIFLFWGGMYESFAGAPRWITNEVNGVLTNNLVNAVTPEMYAQRDAYVEEMKNPSWRMRWFFLKWEVRDLFQGFLYLIKHEPFRITLSATIICVAILFFTRKKCRTG